VASVHNNRSIGSAVTSFDVDQITTVTMTHIQDCHNILHAMCRRVIHSNRSFTELNCAQNILRKGRKMIHRLLSNNKFIVIINREFSDF